MDELADLYDNYDPNMSTERPNLEPLPLGDYLVQITEAKRVNKDNGDVLVKLTFQVMDGQFEGRFIWENLNLRHSNPQAQEIAQRSYTELWRDAMQLTSPPQVLQDLEWKPVIAKIGVEKRKDTGEMQNRIKQFKPYGQTAPAPAQTARPAVTQGARPAAAPATQGRAPSFLKRA